MDAMGEVIDLQSYRERKTMPTTEDRTRRLAEIAVEKMLLESEAIQIRRVLGIAEDPQPM